MARLTSAAPRTLWILFFSYTTNEVMAAGHVQEFACFTDYDKELVCHWKVLALMNCSKEFLLYYRKEFFPLPNSVCVPENGKESLKCTCTIYPDYFVSGLTYVLALQYNGTDMWNYSVTPALVVKPRAPKNLAIEKVENGNFNLSWEESYSRPSMLFGQPVIHEVKYWRKQHPTEVSVKAIKYGAKSFEITASSLKRGYGYVASVRCNYTDYPAYWSEWSEEVEFYYEYRVTAEDILQMALPVSCILIMALSVICYFCFIRVKKEWWDQIPNPAKSHLVIKNVKVSVLCYIQEIKLPFHDLKQNHMEKEISCKSCLAQILSSQNFKGRDNIRHVEKSCSCHNKSGEWFLKGSSAVLTPETILVEESIEICECLTDTEAEHQEETSDHIAVFEPSESSVSAFREHTEHNDALASMFIKLLADENMQDHKDADIIMGESKTFEKLESENPSQQNTNESTAQSRQPCDVCLFTRASQDDYNCSTASKKSEQSEESFESGYHSSSINSVSLDAGELQHMVHQSLFPCSSESQHDSCVLIQESPNKPSFGTKKDRVSSPAHKSFDTLLSPSVGLCSSAYKSFDTLTSPSMKPCGSAYKSFDTLMSPSMEPCGSAYKSFDTLTSASMEPCGSAYKSFDTLTSPSMEPCGSAYKSFDTLTSASMEPCGSAYKSFDTLTSPSVEPCGSAYKSFDTLTSASMEPCGSAYKSFDTLMSPSMEPCGSAYKSFDTLTSASMEPCGSAYKSFDTLTSPSMEPCGSACKSFDTLTSASMEPCGSAYKSFDTLTSPSMEPCGSAYKSFDTLTSPSMEPCGSAYKSFDTLTSPSMEPCGSAYKSFDTLTSQSVADSSLSLYFENVCYSPPLTEFSDTPELSCRDQVYQPPRNQTCYTNYRSPCTELDVHNTSSEHSDFPSFHTHASDSASAFLPDEEIDNQVTYQNVQKKANVISCPTGPQPSGYQPFDNVVKCNGMYHGNDSKVISRSQCESFTHLLYDSLRGTPPETVICEPDLKTDNNVCLIAQGFDGKIVPDLVFSADVAQAGDGSLWIMSSNELSGDSKDENTSREELVLHVLEPNYQGFDSRERTTKGTKSNSCNCTGKGMQESSRNRLNTAFRSHMHNHSRKHGNAGENQEVMEPAVGRRCSSAAALAEQSLASTGLNLERQTAEPPELLVSDKLVPPLSVDSSWAADSRSVHSEGSRLAPAIQKRPVELLRGNRKDKRKMSCVRGRVQEDNYYMEVA